ncbi:ABC transporter substrate-binding protein [Nitrincola alkalilacustris]|uniref:ABC transporter substrate-binding protein n=1 Tax=Nitrincola alkalilacustris TaxID=1571224 RepID=UPI00124ECDDA|nr:ABC transporter substrate-binding protein [Nitrincola alkalilacustris]
MPYSNLTRWILTTALALPTLAMAQESLILYTSQPNTDAQMTVDAFTAAHPNIKVEWVRDGTTQLMTRLQAELSAGVSKPDVLLIADSVTMEALNREGLLQAYLSPERSHYDVDLYHQEGYYYGTKMITTGIAYHTQATQQPMSWQSLIAPEYKNQVVMPSPLYSGAALIHLAAITDQADLGWNYYQQLQKNGTTAHGGNGAVLTAIASGSKPYGVIVDFMAIREAAKGSPIQFVFPEEGVTAVTEPVAIFKQASNPEAAQKFVDFLLSEAGQQLVSEQGYLPARTDIDPPAGFPARNEIKLIPLDAGKALDNADANKQRFSNIFGG